jgi:hypothetical protein
MTAMGATFRMRGMGATLRMRGMKAICGQYGRLRQHVS